MITKKLIYILAIPFFLFLTNCQQHQQAANLYAQQAVAIFPTANLELPELMLDQLVIADVPEDDFTDQPWFEISEYFTPVEKYEFNAQDPRLFTVDNKLVIDLARIRKENYAFPLPGAKLLSEYAGKRRNHTGVDLKVARRDTVLAAFDGVVRLARRNATYGNVVVIRHYNGLETLYSHNTQNLVKPGDRVKAGDPIGTTGQTGRASTDHLHFEIRINGQHFNPALVFDFQTQELNDKTLLCIKNGAKIQVHHVDPFPLQAAYHKSDSGSAENS